MEFEYLPRLVGDAIDRRRTYRATDGSGLSFYCAQPPVRALANFIGHRCSGPVGPFGGTDIELARLTRIRTAQCGSRRRPGDPIGWTSAVRYTVYRYNDDVVIAEMSGCGPSFFLLHQLEAQRTWDTVCDLMPEPLLWDLCRALIGTHDFAKASSMAATEREWKTAYLEGRIRKRRWRNDAEIIPANPAIAA